MNSTLLSSWPGTPAEGGWPCCWLTSCGPAADQGWRSGDAKGGYKAVTKTRGRAGGRPHPNLPDAQHSATSAPSGPVPNPGWYRTRPGAALLHARTAPGGGDGGTRTGLPRKWWGGPGGSPLSFLLSTLLSLFFLSFHIFFSSPFPFHTLSYTPTLHSPSQLSTPPQHSLPACTP